ncbi:MAG TPA: hypothetical protein DIV44_08930 [Leeuwenhoekiella sp.]|nr:hypothetical protein [Leeuwenhoekiella sp.]HBO30063.1 hypothetical protein [Leeuwenhoekiella sp.]HCQ76916.1 hypothetical protein [Leeuwenhoekiella sp.]|tara:strand:- start:721 stop:1368 length:648 start_codon:yes stop_codon:yes gene_type:complete
MKLLITSIVIFISCLTSKAQVGINTNTPRDLLDVNGDTRIDGKLFLEDPGNSNQIRGSKLIIERQDLSIVQYDIDISKYGPINYAELVFENTSNRGVENYNTKISIEDYVVTVQGYYFIEHDTGNTSVITESYAGNDVVEGFQVHAYKNTDESTWFIRGFANNGFFRTGNTDITIDLHMNLIIYRKGFIAKDAPGTYYINMQQFTNATLLKPPGF